MISIVWEINLWPVNVGKDFLLGSSSFGAVKLTKNANLDKYKYSAYGIRSDASGKFLSSNNI